MTRPTPPALAGLPLLGNTLDYIRDPLALLRRGYETHGPIFSLRLGRRRAAVLLGPELNRFFFRETDKLLSMRETFRWLIPLFGDQFPLVAEPHEHRRLLPIYMLPFKEGRMDGYIGAMAQETLAWLDSLGDEGEFELIEAFGRLTTLIAARAILGEEVRQHLGAAIPELFADLAHGTNFHLIRNLTRNLPHFRRRRARMTLDRVMQQAIAERRARHTAHHDFLQALLEVRYPSGEASPDEFIINLLLGMVWAARPTTLGQASWSLILLLQHPAYLNLVVAELESLLGNGVQLGRDVLGKLEHLEWALKEAERMRPAVLAIGRYTMAPYDVGGYHVPQGWMTLISPAMSHRLPDVFPEPDRYDPHRFSPGRAEDSRTPFSLIGFGGGSHTCLGKQFAYTEITVILGLLLQRYTLELAHPNPRPKAGTNPNRPREPVVISYRRRIRDRLGPA